MSLENLIKNINHIIIKKKLKYFYEFKLFEIVRFTLQ